MKNSSSLPVADGLLAVAGVLLASAALGAQSVNDVQTATATVDALSPLAALVPLGVSPFLALGLFGAMASFSAFTLPPSLGILSHPFVWGALLVMAVFFHVGRSFKLTKPLVEIAGTTESLVAFVAMGMLLLGQADPVAAQAEVLEAGIFGAGLLVLAAMTGLVSLITVRMAIDFLTWLSPIPMIDAFLQFAKLGLTGALVAIAVFLPTVAIAMNIVLLVAMLAVARWIYRASRLIGAVLFDRLASLFDPITLEAGQGFLEPTSAWVMSTRCGLPRFGRVPVRWTAGAGWMAGPGGSGTDVQSLGASGDASLASGLLGTTLVTPQATILFTARYRDAGRFMSSVSGTPLVVPRFGGGPKIEVRTI